MKFNSAKSCIQGSKKIPSSSLGQVDFVAVPKLTCTMGKGPSKSFPRPKQDMAPGKQNVRDTCPKDWLEFRFFRALSWYIYLVIMSIIITNVYHLFLGISLSSLESS